MTYRLTNRQNCPPNGFIVRVKGLVPKVERTYWSFYEAVNFYQKFSMANPQLGLPQEWTDCETVVDEQNARRVARMPGASSYVVEVDTLPNQFAKVSTAPSVKKCCGMR